MSARRDTPARTRQRGAALLTVLVLTATMSALAVAMLGDMRVAIRRTADVRAVEQAVWYALGAESLGVAAIRRSLAQQPNRASLQSLWARGEQRFAIDGGIIVGEVRDGGNCFNLNSLVRPEGAGRLRRAPEPVGRFLALLAALDIDPAQATAIADKVVDWLDDDARPAPRGAEDFAYADLAPPYRTSGSPMADITELRGVAGIDAVLYRRLERLLCVHPDHAPSRLNVNTLSAADAPLIVMLTGGELPLRRARDVIADRPTGGYAALTSFWAHPAFAEIEVSEAMRGRAALSTRYFEVAARIGFRDQALLLVSLYRRESGTDLVRLSRKLEPAA